MKETYINDDIKSKVVKLIMADGSVRGLVPTYIALNMASEEDLDLVQVGVTDDEAKNPICRLMNYGKVKYREDKRKKHKDKLVVKEIKFGFNISEHDMAIKINQILKFLDKKYHVKFSLELTGRYRQMKEEALFKFQERIEQLSDKASIGKIVENNNNISTVLRPIDK